MDELLVWCVVANVAADGLKHFSPGTKVWVLPPQWDGTESLLVVGRHRGRGHGRFVRLVVPRVHLANFRVRGVYQPAVHRELTRAWRDFESLRQWESEEHAQKLVAFWSLDATVQAGVDKPGKRVELFHCVRWLMAGESEYAIRKVMDPEMSFELGVLFRDQQEVDAVHELRELLDTIETAGVANWRNNELWPVVRTVAGKTQALLSR
ncbi:hypothetical protein [Lentzea aerocolonigenes]|uniref:hypothetical protein n=1 Tax=Lentzea aerocolonigenes TaxID=68170 RepID=UPI0012E1C463|nr:hypothetical protein [Lentzea aerocolonigenes]